MADLLAAAAAFSDLPQAWQAPRKRLPAAARRAFAGRLKDRLVLPALKQALQPSAERRALLHSRHLRRPARPRRPPRCGFRSPWTPIPPADRSPVPP